MIVYIYSYIAYALFEFVLRKKVFTRASKGKVFQYSQWKIGKEYCLFLSPGYWFARYYKNQIVMLCPDAESAVRKAYLKSMNLWNLLLTCLFSISYLVFMLFHLYFVEMFSGFIAFRFISRMFEVLYAFTCDVLSNKNRSNLTKDERIKLALFSYIELFFLSAPIYIILDLVCDPISAFSASLSVGTLTNVGFLVNNGSSIYANVAFIQVFVTMSLVIFSLAMYLSREQ